MSCEPTSDRTVITNCELLGSFGQSSPAGDAQINSVKTPRIGTKYIYCAGDACVKGNFTSPINAVRGVVLAPGSVFNPSITFANGPSPGGIYSPSPGTVAIAGTASIDTITTQSASLVFNPAGPYVDFSGKTIINAAGIGLPTIGDPNDVIINDPTGVLTSEEHLATRRGGTGLDSSTQSGIAKVATGTWSFALISDDDIGDLTGLTVTNLTADVVIADSGLIIDAPIVNMGGAALVQYASMQSGSATYTGAVVTTNDTPGVIFELATASRTAYVIRGMVACAEPASDLTTSYTFVGKAKNVAVLTLSALTQVGRIADGDLDINMELAASGSSLRIHALGLAGRTINWSGRFDILSQQF